MAGAYAHLNLRINPFGELPPHVRSRLAVANTAPLVEALRKPGTAVQLVGRCGRGKSSHLLALHRELPESHYARLWTDQPPPSALSGDILLIDEADAVWAGTRLRLLRRGRSVAVAVHRDQSWILRLAGFRVLTVEVGSVDRERLRAIVQRRIEFARLGPGPLPGLDDPVLDALLDTHGDDIRAMETPLYAAFQTLQAVEDLTPTHLYGAP
ncbi:MAG: hypothetical protein KC912_23630 [Proteobacteria bacterium]|nr:hypothetical protein [Pseudomonadota bacterium]